MRVCMLGARVHKWLVGGSKTNCGFHFGESDETAQQSGVCAPVWNHGKWSTKKAVRKASVIKSDKNGNSLTAYSATKQTSLCWVFFWIIYYRCHLSWRMIIIREQVFWLAGNTAIRLPGEDKNSSDCFETRFLLTAAGQHRHCTCFSFTRRLPALTKNWCWFIFSF